MPTDNEKIISKLEEIRIAVSGSKGSAEEKEDDRQDILDQLTSIGAKFGDFFNKDKVVTLKIETAAKPITLSALSFLGEVYKDGAAVVEKINKPLQMLADTLNNMFESITKYSAADVLKGAAAIAGAMMIISAALPVFAAGLLFFSFVPIWAPIIFGIAAFALSYAIKIFKESGANIKDVLSFAAAMALSGPAMVIFGAGLLLFNIVGFTSILKFGLAAIALSTALIVFTASGAKITDVLSFSAAMILTGLSSPFFVYGLKSFNGVTFDSILKFGLASAVLAGAVSLFGLIAMSGVLLLGIPVLALANILIGPSLPYLADGLKSFSGISPELINAVAFILLSIAVTISIYGLLGPIILIGTLVAAIVFKTLIYSLPLLASAINAMGNIDKSVAANGISVMRDIAILLIFFGLFTPLILIGSFAIKIAVSVLDKVIPMLSSALNKLSGIDTKKVGKAVKLLAIFFATLAIGGTIIAIIGFPMMWGMIAIGIGFTALAAGFGLFSIVLKNMPMDRLIIIKDMMKEMISNLVEMLPKLVKIFGDFIVKMIDKLPKVGEFILNVAKAFREILTVFKEFLVETKLFEPIVNFLNGIVSVIGKIVAIAIGAGKMIGRIIFPFIGNIVGKFLGGTSVPVSEESEPGNVTAAGGIEGFTLYQTEVIERLGDLISIAAINAEVNAATAGAVNSSAGKRLSNIRKKSDNFSNADIPS